MGPSSISRIDQQRVTRVSTWPGGRPLGEIAKDVERKLAQISVPEGFSVVLKGETAEQDATFRNLEIGIWLSLFLVFAVMAVQFESIRQPLIIMVAIPFGVVGAIFGHLIMGYSMSVISILGVVALSGVVINGSLVLIAFINYERRELGYDAHRAVVNGAIQRFRPIVLTTVTTFGGLAPMIFETSRQARFLIPMALSLGYGILFSTLITLLIIPCLYMVIEDVVHIKDRVLAFLGFGEDEEAVPDLARVQEST